MSRLADILMRMDQEHARRPDPGSAPPIVAGPAPRRAWRIVGTLVIVVIMALLSAALWLRPQVSTLQAATNPAPVHLPAPPSLTEAVVTSSRGQAAALIQSGLVAARNGETEAAIAAFQRATDLEPADAQTWTNLGVVLARSGHEAQGIEAFRRALRAVPDHPEAHRNLAVLLDRQGREAEAARHYRAYLDRSAMDAPDRAPVAARLGEMSAGKAAE